MKQYALWSKIYHHPVFVCLQIGFVLFCVVWILQTFSGTLASSKWPLFLLSLVGMKQVFFHFFIKRHMPKFTLQQQHSGDMLDVLTMQASEVLLVSPQYYAQQLLRDKTVRFFLQKTGIEKSEVAVVLLSEIELVEQAAVMALKAGGTYVTPIDLFISYLMLSEKQTSLLLKKKLKEHDLICLSQWVRLVFVHSEEQIRTRVQFLGQGIGEEWVSGWTLETQKYTQDFTRMALKKETSLIQRHYEEDLITEALSKKENNNVVLVGEEGVGKEQLVARIAIASFEGKLSRGLNHKRVLQFLAGSFLAGASSKADVEERLKGVIEELKHAQHVILYIPSFQDILGASSFGLDLSESLLPYLHDGSLPIIASLTPGNAKTYLEKNPIREVFTSVAIAEPSGEQSLPILYEVARGIEQSYHLSVSYQAVTTALSLAHHYLPDELLPGSAATLLTDSANAVGQTKKSRILREEDVIQKAQEKAGLRVAAPTDQEKKLLLELEPTLHKRVIGQDEAVNALANALRRIRSGIASTKKPASFLFLGPTGVGKTEAAKTLADLYFGGEKNMIRLDMSEYGSQESMTRLLGSTSQKGELTEKVHDNPYGLVLLDEFEKAHPDILNLFLQILDDGRLTDGTGKTVSFVDSCIIATSNAGSELIREHITKQDMPSEQLQKTVIDTLQTEHIFKPELLNRFDSIIMFHPLDHTSLLQVVKLMLEETKQKLMAQDITVTFAPAVEEFIVQKGADSQFGARPLRRFIQDTIEEVVAKKLLDNSLTRGSIITIGLDGQNQVSITTA